MKVLITNIALAGRNELHVRDLALGLIKRGVAPTVFSPNQGGKLPGELRDHGVEVIDDLRKIAAPPDLIHGHHNLPTMVALLTFPNVPGLFVCHDALAWHDAPPLFPSLKRYVAVDSYCYERLTQTHSLPADRVSVIGNAVDLERFRPRAPLPPRPRRALVFSNYATPYNYLPVVQEACRRTGIELDVRGCGVNHFTETPEALLGDYDLVFAKARCAMEAMAVGAAVVLCGVEGTGPLVTPDQFEHLRRFNFGRHVIQNPLQPDLLVEQIERYSPESAAAVSRTVRETCSLERMIDQWLDLYQTVLAENPAPAPDAAQPHFNAAAAFLLQVEPQLFSLYELDATIAHLKGELRTLQSQAATKPSSGFDFKKLFGR